MFFKSGGKVPAGSSFYRIWKPSQYWALCIKIQWINLTACERERRKKAHKHSQTHPPNTPSLHNHTPQHTNTPFNTPTHPSTNNHTPQHTNTPRHPSSHTNTPLKTQSHPSTNNHTPQHTYTLGSSDFGTLTYFKQIWIAVKILRSNYKIRFSLYLAISC
jgi:hypothetical protein